MKQKRDYNLDILRIIATFMVIVIHVCAYYWYTTPITDFNWKVYTFYDSIVLSAVPIFIMISGCLFLDNNKKIDIKKLYLKNIGKLIFLYFIFSIVYILYNISVKNATYNLSSFIKATITGPHHFWYIPVIIGLYIITPLLRKITMKCDKNLFKYFVFLFIFGSFFKTLSYLTFIPGFSCLKLLINLLPINIICQYYSYFILGYMLYKFNISKKIVKYLQVIGIISILLCAILTYYLSKYNGVNDCALMENFSIFILFEAIALFLFIKNKKIIFKEKNAAIVTMISSCTLGIYIIHVLIMNFLFDFNIIHIYDFNSVLSIPIISILIFIICLTIVYLYKIIMLKFKKLFQNKNLNISI